MGKSKTIAKGKKQQKKPQPRPVASKAKAVAQVAKAVVQEEKKKGYAPGLLGGIGNAVGGFFGGGAGATVGTSIGNWLGKITGMGAYKVKRNSLMAGAEGPPMFNSGGSCVMTHREFLGDVSGTVAFTNTSYPINPGLTSLFPWLSLCAAQFEEYELLGMIVQFKSTSATALNSTNTALGTVIMATDYDRYDTNFQSKIQMESYEFCTSAAPSVSQIHPIECDPRLSVLGRKYVRSGSVPTGADARFYDVGNFQIATSGMQAAAVIGELWVSYQVRFSKPKLPTPIGQNLLCAHYAGSFSSTAMSMTGFIQRAGSTVDLTISGTTISGVPPGRWVVSQVTNAPTLVTVGPTFAASTGATAVNLLYNASLTPSATSTLCTYDTGFINLIGIFEVSANTGAITLSGGSIASTVGAKCDLMLFQISAGLTMEGVQPTLMERLSLLEGRFSRAASFDTPPGTPIEIVEDTFTRV